MEQEVKPQISQITPIGFLYQTWATKISGTICVPHDGGAWNSCAAIEDYVIHRLGSARDCRALLAMT
jgi:hypothetical protein